MFPNVANTPSHNCPLIGAFGSMTTATAITRATAHCASIRPSAEADVKAWRLPDDLWHLRDPQVLRSYLALVKGTWLIHTCWYHCFVYSLLKLLFASVVCTFPNTKLMWSQCQTTQHPVIHLVSIFAVVSTVSFTKELSGTARKWPKPSCFSCHTLKRACRLDGSIFVACTLRPLVNSVHYVFVVLLLHVQTHWVHNSLPGSPNFGFEAEGK